MDDGKVHSDTTGRMRVFIVEDAPNMQVALGDLVCAAADAVICAVVGSEAKALEWAASHAGAWDLAIVDLTLEQGDGFNIVRQLGHRPDCGVVVVFSAYVTDVIRRHCESLGAHAVFHKTESRQLAQYIEDLARSPLPG
ncbi:MAG TPA: response regulator [Ramlibacter sp.]|uniref:response regulator n=1 Tax=Ramlibacter sp. TaxID=1917967 RepID=UPI002ED092C6